MFTYLTWELAYYVKFLLLCLLGLICLGSLYVGVSGEVWCGIGFVRLIAYVGLFSVFTCLNYLGL